MFILSLLVSARMSFASPPLPLVCGASVVVKGIKFGFPQDHRPDSRATCAVFGPALTRAMADKVDADVLNNRIRATVTVDFWTRATFGAEGLKLREGSRRRYVMVNFVPPDATAEEVEIFAHEVVDFIPSRAQVEKLGRKLRPYRVDPGPIRRCADWLLYEPHIDLF